jgi:hypothetical protein
MALPSSGQISFADLQAEFGGSNPISISEFRASNHNSAKTSGGPNYRIADVSKNTVNNKLQLNGNDVDFININTDSKLVLVLESGVWNDGNLYFSTTNTPGNNNLLNTGVTNNGAGTGSIMVIDGADAGFTSSTNGVVNGYLKSDTTTASTAVEIQIVTDPGNTTTAVDYLYGKARFSFSDAGSFVGGSVNTKITSTSNILDTDNGVIVPNGQSVDFSQVMTALPTIWAGGTWHYYYLNLYDASWDASTKVFTFDNFRNVAWTNNTGYTNGSGTFLNSSNNNATNVANYVASSAGYNVARAPNYAGTSENVTLQMTNSGSTLNHTFTNNTGGYVLLYKYTMSNSSGFPAGSNNRLGSLLWADSAGNFTNAHTVNGTGCFETFSRQNFGFPTWLRITFYFTPVGSGTETQVGFYNYIFDDGSSQTDALNKIKTDTEAYFHDALDTGENYPYMYCDVNADSVDFRYYLPGILRIVPEYYRYGYNQGGAGGVAHTSTAASAIQGHSNYNFANFKSNELTTAANGNQNIKRQTLNMSLSQYYNARGELTLGSG